MCESERIALEVNKTVFTVHFLELMILSIHESQKIEQKV